MHTRLLDDPAEAAALLLQGEIVAFPTETVYGLGACIHRQDALLKVYEAKGRPADNPLIVHVNHVHDVFPLVADLPLDAVRLMAAFWPGPLTLVLPKHPNVPLSVTAGLQTIAVRQPGHATAIALLDACGVPLAAPSANRSGRPSPTTWEAVYADLDGRIAAILRGPRADVGLESTVVDFSQPHPTVLRVGAISLEALQDVVPEIHIAHANEALARSPGTRYRHYAPSIPLQLVDQPEAPAVLSQPAGWLGVAPPTSGTFAFIRVMASLEDYAHQLYAILREAEAHNLAVLVCQTVEESGLGRAINDRLRKAATA